MQNIRTLLFDVDGTLLDTKEFIFQAAEHALSHFGFAVPSRAEIAASVGLPFEEFYFSLCKSRKDVPSLMDMHRNFQLKNRKLAIPFPGAAEILGEFEEKGFKLAAVTSRSKKTSIKSLLDCGLHSFFSVIISAEDSDKLKPHPDPLIKALKLMDEGAETAVMIGDSSVDIEAGKNAGTKTVRASYGFNQDRMHDPKPDFFIEDIKDLPKIILA